MTSTAGPPAHSSSPQQRLTLPAEINAATLKQHSALNRLITDRLPLALPPYQDDPAVLGQGLAAFAWLFFAFESVWEEFIFGSNGSINRGGTEKDLRNQWLCDLRSEGMHRTERLKSDLHFIAQRTRRSLPSITRKQQNMLNAMCDSIREKPHTLVAYAWVFYMAIFSGGRWIRAQLAAAGSEYWTGEAEMSRYDKGKISDFGLPGFSFLSFDGRDDGQDVKARFKGRLEEAEAILTLQERNDIVLAAQKLFNDCIELVGIIEKKVQGSSMPESEPSLKLVLTVLGIIFAALCYFVGYKRM